MAADIPGFSYDHIPFNLAPSKEYKPDLIFYREENQQKEIIIAELTVPLTWNVEKRHAEKTKKYTDWSCTFPDDVKSTVIAFEVASDTGFVSQSIIDRIICFFLTINSRLNPLIQYLKALKSLVTKLQPANK